MSRLALINEVVATLKRALALHSPSGQTPAPICQLQHGRIANDVQEKFADKP
jgi:hypothetical protein